MKKITKKLIGAGLVLSLGTTLVGGCAETADEQESPDGKRKNVTITIGMWPEDTDSQNIELFNNYKLLCESKYDWITVQPAHYKYSVESFIPIAESGQTPTIFDTWFTEPQKLIANGYVKDITDIMQEKGWYDMMEPTTRDLLSADGRLYGVPRDSYALGLFININLFEEAGLVDDAGLPIYPTTLDELAQTAQTIKQKTGKAGFCLLSKDNSGGWHFSNIAWNFGATLQYQDDSGRWLSGLNSPETVAAMEWVKSLKWEYDCLTDEMLQDWSSGHQAIGTNNAAMEFAALDAVNVPTKDYGLSKDKLALVPFPAGPGGSHSLMGGTPYMFSASATDEEVEAALLFLEIMGRAPVVNEEARQGRIDDAKYRQSAGIPVIPPMQVWVNEEYTKMVDEIDMEYSNINYELFRAYYEVSQTQLKAEEPNLSQDMYAEIYPVIQAVLTDKNANVQQLLDTASSNFQKKLDASPTASV